MQVPYILSAKNTAAVDFVSAERPNLSSTKIFIKLKCFEQLGPGKDFFNNMF